MVLTADEVRFVLVETLSEVVIIERVELLLGGQPDVWMAGQKVGKPGGAGLRRANP